MLYQSLLTKENFYVASISDGCSYFLQHQHVELEFLYLINGKIRVEIDGTCYTAKKGDIVFIGSMASHTILESEYKHRFLLLEFGPFFIGDRFADTERLTAATPILNIDTHPQMEDIIALFEEIVAEKMNPTAVSELIISGNISKITAYLSRMLDHEKKPAASGKSEKKVHLSPEKIIDFITYHYMEDLTVAEAARMTGYSVSNFCRIFKITFGKSFHAMLNEARIKNACALLFDKKLSVNEIARAVGYDEAKSFCRIFKKLKGCTPTQYAKKNG